MNLRSLSLLGATLLFAGLLQTAGSPQAAASPQRAALGAKKAAPSPYAAGVADMKARKWSQAEAQFRRAISRKDHLERAYAGLGTAAAWLGDYKTAVTAFKRAVALDANDGEAQAGLGQAALVVHDYPTAYHAYQKLTQKFPRNPYYLYQTAYAALYAGDFHATVSYADKYIKIAPKDWKGFHLRFLADGNLLLKKQQVADAYAIVHLRPQDPTAYNDLGIALANDQQYKSSIRILTVAIKLNARNPLYYMNRGISESLNKQPNLALRDLRTARSLTKDAKLRKQIDATIYYLQRRAHG